VVPSVRDEPVRARAGEGGGVIDPIVLSTASAVRMAICFLVAPSTVNTVTLEGACGVASYALLRALKMRGRRATFVQGWHECDCGGERCAAGIGHCWVQTGGEIVDITAAQFHIDATPVFVPESEAELERYKAERRGTRAIHAARSWYRLQQSWLSPLFEPRAIDALVSAAIDLQERDERARRTT
jgi:hypothetical protein